MSVSTNVHVDQMDVDQMSMPTKWMSTKWLSTKWMSTECPSTLKSAPLQDLIKAQIEWKQLTTNMILICIRNRSLQDKWEIGRGWAPEKVQ